MNPQKKLMTALFAIACLALCASVFAQGITFTTGQPLNHMLNVCLDKADAIEILKAHEKDGYEAAKEVWEKKEKCDTLPVSGPKVGRVVFSIRSEGKDVKVVEIVGDEVVGYFITSSPVEAKRDRNA